MSFWPQIHITQLADFSICLQVLYCIDSLDSSILIETSSPQNLGRKINLQVDRWSLKGTESLSSPRRKIHFRSHKLNSFTRLLRWWLKKHLEGDQTEHDVCAVEWGGKKRKASEILFFCTLTPRLRTKCHEILRKAWDVSTMVKHARLLRLHRKKICIKIQRLEFGLGSEQESTWYLFRKHCTGFLAVFELLFKILILTYKALNVLVLQYLCELLIALRSSNAGLLTVKSIQSVFKSSLKTYSG